MNFDLDEDHIMMRKMVRDFAEKNVVRERKNVMSPKNFQWRYGRKRAN